MPVAAEIPNQPVPRRVEHVVQRNRQLDRAKTRREMPAGLGDRVEDRRAKLRANLLELGLRKRAEVVGRRDAITGVAHGALR